MRVFFFFQAEDGIRDLTVTGVQTCALPISRRGQGHGTGHAQVQGPGGRQGREPDRARRAVGGMTAPGGGAPSVLETLEFPAALEPVAAYAAGPLVAARVRSRAPVTDTAANAPPLPPGRGTAGLVLRPD